ncbi:MAG: rhodanese-like domain-containing protein [Alphaproteobacteria bacterium]|nr:rhodanese-like domain-containing protein [Alphaproteobacteria bacterium]
MSTAAIGGLLALAVLLLGPSVAWAGGKLSADEAFARSQRGDVLLVDIRSTREWRETGIPSGAKAVTIHNSKGLPGFYEELLATVEGDKTRPVALICAVGGRSARAHRYLQARGFTNVYDVSEGMIGRFDSPGWLKRGLPTETCTAC